MHPSGADVVTSVTANTLEAAEALGWPVHPDWAAAGIDVDRLRVGRGWLSWEEYVRVLELLAGPDAGTATQVELGAVILRHGVRGPFRHFGKLADGAGPLFKLIYGRMMRSTVRVVRSTVSELGPGHLRVRLAVDADRARGEVFFHVVHGTMRHLPNLFGLPDARVQASVSAHEAVYDVRLVPGRTLLSRLGRAGRVLVGREDAASSQALMVRVDEAVQNLHDAEARLGEAEERWRQLAEGVPGLVVVIDADGRVVDAHGSAVRPRRLEVGGLWPDVFVAQDRAAVSAQLAEHQGSAPIEVRAEAPDGAATWWTCRAAALSGSPPRRVVIAIDVTERRRTEEALREAERRYLQTQKRDAIGRLSGGLAHDINNVLTVLLANADRLEAAVEGDHTAAAARTPLDGIRAAVGRASALTRRLLASGRMRAPGTRASDLSALCRDALGVLPRLVGENVALRIEVPEGPVRVALEEDRVEQILLNLVVNARDALPTGGVLTVRVEEGERGPTLVVRDDGIGMTADVLARATEPFFTTKPVGLGSGLGLSTVAEIVGDAGGDLRIESAPGRGTTVRVALPAADDDAPMTVRAEEAAPTPGAARRVLLVEDQDDVRELLAQSLERLGFRVTPRGQGEAALRDFLRDPGGYDLMVTDLVMPGMGGRETAGAIREVRPELPVLLMSGYAAPGDTTIAGSGRVGFLAKPFRASSLATALTTLLDECATPA